MCWGEHKCGAKTSMDPLSSGPQASYSMESKTHLCSSSVKAWSKIFYCKWFWSSGLSSSWWSWRSKKRSSSFHAAYCDLVWSWYTSKHVQKNWVSAKWYLFVHLLFLIFLFAYLAIFIVDNEVWITWSGVSLECSIQNMLKTNNDFPARKLKL